MASEWISYNELAWTEDFLANPADYEEEVNEYIKIIKKTEKIPVKTILHLGSGAGGYDIHFKKHFKIKGVDISVGMLEKARNI
ncbi:MAG: class I SAM-dependent methyltransferase, partial [Candidatus Absconditabacterales bacterium]|nr:class I SAM-dependent methyltransferase [Candidatus Absconditabacterales bacterium]